MYDEDLTAQATRLLPASGARLFSARDIAEMAALQKLESGAYPYFDKAAYLLSIASGWLYSDAPTFTALMSDIGQLDDCEIFAMRNDAMFIDAPACVAVDGKMAAHSFRGTQPGNIWNWLTDASVEPVNFLKLGQ